MWVKLGFGVSLFFGRKVEVTKHFQQSTDKGDKGHNAICCFLKGTKNQYCSMAKILHRLIMSGSD